MPDAINKDSNRSITQTTPLKDKSINEINMHISDE